MTVSLALYRLGTRLLEPLAPSVVSRRVKAGKENQDRVGERFGATQATRPAGPVIWMHAASVGESRLLLDILAALRKRSPDVHAVITTQTTTSAHMIAAANAPNVTHQMAPIDGPKAVGRFMDHWQPDAAVFAEGEIWPNMLDVLKRKNIPAALVNARMTTKSLRGWNTRSGAAKRLFSAFGFIGAADQATASGLAKALGREIEIVGNLKLAAIVQPPPTEKVSAFRDATSDRAIVLAASTHPGEDEFAVDAFAKVRARKPDTLMILVPRHPERGNAIVAMLRERGLATSQWSRDRSPPGLDVNVLVADTIGELLFWYASADAVYLGGATVEGIGGHNPIEPTQLGKRIFTGPHGFNFAETFELLRPTGALMIGTTSRELADHWLASLDNAAPVLGSLVVDSRIPFEKTLDAIEAMLPKTASHA